MCLRVQIGPLTNHILSLLIHLICWQILLIWLFKQSDYALFYPVNKEFQCIQLPEVNAQMYHGVTKSVTSAHKLVDLKVIEKTQ